MLLSVFPIFAPLQPSKPPLQPFLYMVACARTLYIGKRLKAHYLPFAAVFRLRCMFVLSFVSCTLAAVLYDTFRYLDYL